LPKSTTGWYNPGMNNENVFEWFAPEYEEKEHSDDWFWAFGIIVVTSALASIIYADYFFAALIILAGGLLWFFAKKKPEMVHYELGVKGIKMGTHFYAYENLKAFWVQVGATVENPNALPTLFLKSDRWFMPIISIPIENDFAQDIHAVLLSQNIPEEEIREHPYQKIIEVLGF
jgi:hypothetical protein